MRYHTLNVIANFEIISSNINCPCEQNTSFYELKIIIAEFTKKVLLQRFVTKAFEC